MNGIPSDNSHWSRSVEEVAADLGTDSVRGLDVAEAASRLEQFGRNELAGTAGRSPWAILFAQFADFMIGLLAGAALVSVFIGEWHDAILIAIIVLANAGIGFAQEWRAEKAVEALRAMTQPIVRVRRSGSIHEIDAAEVVPGDVVPGDVVLLSRGDFVPADGRVLEAVELNVDEAALTGESLAIVKTPEPAADDAVLAERTSMAYSGTAVAAGTGRLLVTATGDATELGRIAALIESADETQTPLQRRLESLGKRLAMVVVGLCVIVFAAGVLREPYENWDQVLIGHMLLVAVSLAVAAIPEGLPAVITVALSLGSRRMADRNAIVRRLSAVETLGSVDVVCSDKTGTLTQNRMVVREVLPAIEDEDGRERLLVAGVLCNDAELAEDGHVVGSATERAILEAGLAEDLDAADLREAVPRLDAVPFDSVRKLMVTLHRDMDERILFVKGAAEAVVGLCTRAGVDAAGFGADDRAEWEGRARDLAEQGRRVLAVAEKPWDAETLPKDGTAARELVFLGLLAIVDPVRPEAADAVASCRTAGVRTVMITGDHPGTAKAIAGEIDLYRDGDEVVTGRELDELDDDGLAERVDRIAVYARVTPEHKLRIVRAHQSNARVVSMTGDGVNDAPALKQADIGVAMGITGTDVAKESAEMVLADDDFATIVAAVEEGRTVFDNIRRFVRYLLTTNCGEVLTLLIAILIGLPLPLLPVHILWINLVTDGLPALALGFEPAEPDVMRRPPRRVDEGVITTGMTWGVLWIGLLMAITCAGGFWWLLHMPAEGLLALPDGVRGDANRTEQYARTWCFVTLSTYQLFYVMGIRSSSRSAFASGLWDNYRLTGAVLAGLVLQFAVVYVPVVDEYFHTLPLSPVHLALSLAVSTLAFWVAEAAKLRTASPVS